ncbi:MAG TPA: SCO family protein [Chloroflexota bacterium]|nr:SCO family protein [Chloroflexota bacterium]
MAKIVNRRRPATGGKTGKPPATQRGAASGVPIAIYVLVAAGVLIFIAGLAGLLFSLHTRSQQLNGPTISGNPPAPNFALTDQNGQPVQLAGLRGKVVALTFLYTNCPDVCPLIATKLGQADQQLGADSSKVALLAVTVDPVHDTAAAVRAFDVEHQLQQANWHYLLGSVAQLTPVWKTYFVGTDAAQVAGSPATKVSAPTPQLVNHTAIVYLIDRQGNLREALDANFTPQDFLHDVRVLAAQ